MPERVTNFLASLRDATISLDDYPVVALPKSPWSDAPATVFQPVGLAKSRRPQGYRVSALRIAEIAPTAGQWGCRGQRWISG